MAEPVKAGLEEAAASGILRTSLKLNGSPVAPGIATALDEIPPGMPEIDSKTRHCRMVSPARNEDGTFYATSERHECMGGTHAPGPGDLAPSPKTGEFYYTLGKFETPTSRRTMESIPHLPSGEIYATMYAPLETAPFTLQVIPIVTTHGPC